MTEHRTAKKFLEGALRKDAHRHLIVVHEAFTRRVQYHERGIAKQVLAHPPGTRLVFRRYSCVSSQGAHYYQDWHPEGAPSPVLDALREAGVDVDVKNYKDIDLTPLPTPKLNNRCPLCGVER